MQVNSVLDQIQKENDIQTINPNDYKRLAKEIRQFLVQKISKQGGHLASNLGVVELTMALHLFLHFPEDKLIFDVGHQSYTHKILTGRKEAFDTLRRYQGMSGFPKRQEHVCDCFDTGHSSTSISAALGFAKARDLKGETNRVVAVIGDGALSGGMAYEALNNAARLQSNLIIVLNDNHMSISENVGGMATYLAKIRTNAAYRGLKDNIESILGKIPGLGEDMIRRIRRSKASLKHLLIPGMLFEDMGITYIGPIDGHQLKQLSQALQSAAQMQKAVLIHVITKKGKGYRFAEHNPMRFHGIEPFQIKNGAPKKQRKGNTYTDVVSKQLCSLAEKRKDLIAITAAMPVGTGLAEFAKRYPDRFFDVGIAEEHAVTFAAGLAAAGMRPVVAIYSTFLQRAYDQILHDVCIERLPVLFLIDRAGLVGRDGETHQGLFDLSYLLSIPNLCVAAPKNQWELEQMISFALTLDGPMAIRYPRGSASETFSTARQAIELGKSEWLVRGKEIALLAVGTMVETAEQVADLLKQQGKSVSVINMRFAKPIDEDCIKEVLKTHRCLVTMEENVLSGGFGQQVATFLSQSGKKNRKQICIAVKDTFVPQGEVLHLKRLYQLDAKSIAKRILKEDGLYERTFRCTIGKKKISGFQRTGKGVYDGRTGLRKWAKGRKSR